MKKKIGILVLSGLFLMISVLFTGCLSGKNDGLSYESDGQFRYHGGEKSYTIIGAEENLPEMVYVPSHYKGKEIVKYYSSYTVPSIHTIVPDNRHYFLYLDNVKRAYFPYNCDRDYFDGSEAIGSKSLTEQFFVSDKLSVPYFISNIRKLHYASSEEQIERIIYINQSKYKKCISEIEKFIEDKGNGYNDRYYSYKIDKHKIRIGEYGSGNFSDENGKNYIFIFFIQIANTSYLFNYDKAPNDGYFFINEFTYGGRIENTPYEPIREGYTFGGWYKESACTNEWNFDEDRLPEAEHDEDGNLQFVETKLYAKWTKK